MHIYRTRDPRSGAVHYVTRRAGVFFEIDTPFEALQDAVSGPDEIAVGAEAGSADTLELMAPAEPTKIVCIGLNYQHHAEEMGKTIPDEPLMFLKPPSALNHPGQPIRLPAQSELVHHEGELAMIVGRRARAISPDDFDDHILGYTCACDVTARDIQRREGRYTRGKGFDTFCPLGPALVTSDSFSPAEHRVQCRINDELRQSSGLDDFIFELPYVVSFVSHVMTLEPGDVILTGTPAGVGPLEDGDTVEVDIDGVGVLRNPVVGVDKLNPNLSE